MLEKTSLQEKSLTARSLFGGVTGVGSDGLAGKTCEASFEQVSVKAVPEPSPVEGVGENGEAIVAEGKTFPLPNSSLLIPNY